MINLAYESVFKSNPHYKIFDHSNIKLINIIGRNYRSRKAPCLRSVKTRKSLGARFSLITLVILTSLSINAYALKIIPHLTEGPDDLAGLTAQFDGPFPLLGNSSTALDCQEVGKILGPDINTTETGALCNVIADWERHVKNDVTVEIEFYKLDIFAITGIPGILGGAFVEVQWLTAPADAHPKNRNGYDATLHWLKIRTRKEWHRDKITAYLPRQKILNAILPDDPFFYANSDFDDGIWKPVSIALTRAQMKALQLKPAKSGMLNEDPQDFFRSLPDIDGALVVNNDLRDPELFFDLNPFDDGPLLGPFSAEEYSSFDFTDPDTLPLGFSIDPFIVDFQGLVKHEIGHFLGAISAVDDLPFWPADPPARENQTVSVMDLYRLEEANLPHISKVRDFRKAPRHWIAEGVNSDCRVETGNAVMLANVSKKGKEVIPLSSGFAGDGRQAGHLRSPYNNRRENQDDCSGPVVGYEFLVEGPFTLMRPSQGNHVPISEFTTQDLRLFDLIGWDIDYQGSQTTSLAGSASLDRAEQRLLDIEIEAIDDRLELHRGVQIIFE